MIDGYFFRLVSNSNEDLHHRFGDPSVVPDHIALLLQVGEEIDELYQTYTSAVRSL